MFIIFWDSWVLFFLPNCILSLFLTAPILFWIFYTFVKVVLCVPMRFVLFKPNCMLNLVVYVLLSFVFPYALILSICWVLLICCVSRLCQPPLCSFVAVVLVCCFCFVSFVSVVALCVLLVELTPSPFPQMCILFESARSAIWEVPRCYISQLPEFFFFMCILHLIS